MPNLSDLYQDMIHENHGNIMSIEEVYTVEYDDQTIFYLSRFPVSTIALYLNNISMVPNREFIVDIFNRSIEWTSYHVLKAGDVIKIRYSVRGHGSEYEEYSQ